MFVLHRSAGELRRLLEESTEPTTLQLAPPGVVARAARKKAGRKVWTKAGAANHVFGLES